MLAATGDKIFKELAKKVNVHPEESRCLTSQGCINAVKSGKHVYAEVRNCYYYFNTYNLKNNRN